MPVMKGGKSVNILTDLFLTFAKIGCFTFGGGYAMLSMIENNCVTCKKWITHEEMMDVTVIAESTPGPIAVNCATYVGYRQAGVPGSVIATLGIVLPPFAVILAVSRFLDHFLEIAVIANAFRGIQAAVAILILDAGITMVRKMRRQALPRILMICAFAAMLLIHIFSRNFSSVSLMLLAAAVSLSVFIAKGAAKRKDGAGK